MKKLRAEIKQDAQRYSEDPVLQKAYEDGANEALRKYPIVLTESQFIDLSLLKTDIESYAGKEAMKQMSQHVIDAMIRMGCYKYTEEIRNGILKITVKAAGLRLLEDPKMENNVKKGE